MNPEFRPTLHLPDGRHLRRALGWGAAAGTTFAAIYGGADWWTQRHAFRFRWHFDIETACPLVPAMSVAYLSLMPLLWTAPFLLRTARQLRAVALTMIAVTCAAGPWFVLLPAEEAFGQPSASELGMWQGPFAFARTIALRHNYFPSLHVAFTTIYAIVYSASHNRRLRYCLLAWSAMIIASTLLTHQHFVLDVAGGLLLGWLGVKLVYRRLLAMERNAVQTSPPNQSIYPAEQA